MEYYSALRPKGNSGICDNIAYPVYITIFIYALYFCLYVLYPLLEVKAVDRAHFSIPHIELN